MSNDSNIIKVIVVDRDGKHHELKGPIDMNMNMMELCRSYELPIEGTCGGMALCASCHMYVKSEHELPERSGDEEDMLDEAFNVEDCSRLGCQIHLSKEVDGLEVHLAPVG